MSRGQLLCGAALLALSSPAMAQSIDTTPAWNGTTSIDPWGTNAGTTPTYGQTITTVAGQDKLTSFTFELAKESGTAPQFQAFVYQFDSTTKLITGPALFTSGIMTAPSGATFTAVTVNTGSLALITGQQYVLFFTTSLTTGQAAASFKYGQLTNATTYAGGQFVFNNTATFAGLSTVAWTTSQPNDLAFMATFTTNAVVPVVPVVPPPPLILFVSPFLPAGAPINPVNVASGIDKAIAAGVTLPTGFNNLFLLTPSQLVGAVTSLSGENSTQAQTGAFELGTSYLSLLTDPFGTNRVGVPSGPMGYAATPKLPPAVAAANAMMTKAPPILYQPHWDVWGAAFGGANSTRGDAVGTGSSDTYTRAGGVAAGADYRFSPNALVGFSLAGGNINWSLTNNLAGGMGGGQSDVFMAAGYGKYVSGAGYVSAAVTYSNYWMTTNRTVTVAGLDQLHAAFNAQGWGGRLEGGYRLPTQFLNVQWTPYAAIQGQSFSTPNYGETAFTGSNQFALNFASRTATAVRGEVGLRDDKVWAMVNGGQVSLFGKLGYAHDETSNPSLAANFTALGAGAAPFTVFGTRPSSDLAVSSTGLEWRLASGVSLMVKADSEYGNHSQTYSGTGRIRYTW